MSITTSKTPIVNDANLLPTLSYFATPELFTMQKANLNTKLVPNTNSLPLLNFQLFITIPASELNDPSVQKILERSSTTAVLLPSVSPSVSKTVHCSSVAPCSPMDFSRTKPINHTEDCCVSHPMDTSQDSTRSRDSTRDLPDIPPLTPSQLADPELTDALPSIVDNTALGSEDEIESIASILIDFSREMSRSSSVSKQFERSASRTPTKQMKSLQIDLASITSCYTPSSEALETQSSESSSSSLSLSSSTPTPKASVRKTRTARKRLFKRKAQRPKKKRRRRRMRMMHL